MVQVNNSFSGQNYLPLSLGFLVSYAEFHCKNYNDFDFLNPIYKRVPIKGDGSGAECTVVVNADQQIGTVDVTNQGSNYTFGTEDIVGGGLPRPDSYPQLDVIIPPSQNLASTRFSSCDIKDFSISAFRLPPLARTQHFCYTSSEHVFLEAVFFLKLCLHIGVLTSLLIRLYLIFYLLVSCLHSH